MRGAQQVSRRHSAGGTQPDAEDEGADPFDRGAELRRDEREAEQVVRGEDLQLEQHERGQAEHRGVERCLEPGALQSKAWLSHLLLTTTRERARSIGARAGTVAGVKVYAKMVPGAESLKRVPTPSYSFAP